MMRFVSIVLFFALTSAIHAQIVPPPASLPTIRFPSLPLPTSPKPGASPKLSAQQLFVIDADIPIMVLASPQGLVTITEEVGPVRIRGLFADGTKIESRVFSGKHVFIVEAVAAGSAELLVIPVSDKTQTKDVIRKTLEVDAQNPQPPPPKPNPPPPDPPPAPDDPIAKAIFGSYQQEFAVDKKEAALKMAQCYEAAAERASTAVTWGDIMTAIRNKTTELGIAGKLPVVSKTINAQLLAAGFPASPSVLMSPGDAERARIGLLKVSVALKSLP